MLHIMCPKYLLEPDGGEFFSGTAMFLGPTTPKELIGCSMGEVRHVFGKKAAREELARQVVAVLHEYAASKVVEGKANAAA